MTFMAIFECKSTNVKNHDWNHEILKEKEQLKGQRELNFESQVHANGSYPNSLIFIEFFYEKCEYEGRKKRYH